jgi:nucleoside-diphosphate kinase
MVIIDYNQITFSIIKPDAVIQGNGSAINTMLEKNGFKILLQVKKHITLEEARFFYQEHKERPFFNDLTHFLSSGPSIVQILYHSQGDTVKRYRDIMGATNPSAADDNTIRKLYGHSIDYNAVHGSDSSNSSHREILCFFSELQVDKALGDLHIKVEDIMKKK